MSTRSEADDDSVDEEEPADGGDGSERRGDLRHLACFPAHVETAEGTPRSALIRDLSVSGALLLTRARTRVGEKVKLALYLGDAPDPFIVSGSVVREERRTGELAHPWTKSVAVQFDALLVELEPQIKALADHQAELFGRRGK